MRGGIKAYSNWPTIPQLYVKGELVGGCDIVREMYEAGELSFLKTSSGAEFPAFQPTGRGEFKKRCLDLSVGHRRGTRRGRKFWRVSDDPGGIVIATR